MHQLSPTDAQMLYIDSPSTPNHIAPLLLFDQSAVSGGKLRFRDIVAKVEQALDGAPNFRRKLMTPPLRIDDPYWVDDPHFDIDFHVRHLALPQPGDWRQLQIQVARLLSRSLDANRPMWEMYVIEGLDNVEGLPAGAFAILFKIHHAMIDGMGAVSLLNGLLDVSPRAGKVEPCKDAWRPQPSPSTTEIVSRAWLRAVLRPGKFMLRVNNLVLAPKAPSQVAGKPDTGLVPPKTPFNGPITPARVYEWKHYKLADAKAMRGLVPGSTVNDVVLAIVAGALRRYLEAKSALPDKSLICSVPVSIRGEATKDNPGGNEITATNVPLFTEVADPIERLARIAGQMAGFKHADNAVRARAIAELTSSLPGTITGLLARGLTAVGDRTARALVANTLVTNVPGMTVPMYMLGAKLVNVGGGGPCMTNMGLIHLVGSYCDFLNFNIVGCRDLLPDSDFYMQCLDESFAEYRDAAAKGPKAR